jgi:acetyl esterase/lipase
MKWLLAATLVLPAFAADQRKPTQEGLVYGEADGQKLTMDYYAPAGPGASHRHRHSRRRLSARRFSKSGSEAYCADFLAPAGYAVFSINYRLAPKYPYPYMVYDVQRSIRYLRHNARTWDADPGEDRAGGWFRGRISQQHGGTPGRSGRQAIFRSRGA